MKTILFASIALAAALGGSPAMADERPLEDLSKAELILKIRNMERAQLEPRPVPCPADTLTYSAELEEACDVSGLDRLEKETAAINALSDLCYEIRPKDRAASDVIFQAQMAYGHHFQRSLGIIGKMTKYLLARTPRVTSQE